MQIDRYLKVVLTVIAVELGWMGFNLAAAPVTAQGPAAQIAPTRVVITGIDMGAVPVQAIGVVKIEADKPLRVENVGYTPSPKPGE